jgi:hypothetical protein
MGKWVAILGRVPMSEREDYAEHDRRPWRVPRAFVKWTARAGAVGLLVGIAVLMYFFTGGVRGSPYRDAYWSVQRAENLVVACQIYRRGTPNGQYPATLADLRKPPSGVDLSWVQDDDLNDVWGTPFRYALVPDANSELEVHIWTEWIRDGKLTLLGVKLPANGPAVPFGLPTK